MALMTKDKGLTTISPASEGKVIVMLGRGFKPHQALMALRSQGNKEITKVDQIKTLAKKHELIISELSNQLIANKETVRGRILDKGLRLMLDRFERAERDQKVLEELQKKYRSAKIGKTTYERRRYGLITLSMTEIVAGIREIANQINNNEQGTNQPTRGDDTPTAAIVKAIKSGDAFELQRLVFHGKDKEEAGVINS